MEGGKAASLQVQTMPLAPHIHLNPRKRNAMGARALTGHELPVIVHIQREEAHCYEHECTM